MFNRRHCNPYTQTVRHSMWPNHNLLSNQYNSIKKMTYLSIFNVFNFNLGQSPVKFKLLRAVRVMIFFFNQLP